MFLFGYLKLPLSLKNLRICVFLFFYRVQMDAHNSHSSHAHTRKEEIWRLSASIAWKTRNPGGGSDPLDNPTTGPHIYSLFESFQPSLNTVKSPLRNRGKWKLHIKKQGQI